MRAESRQVGALITVEKRELKLSVSHTVFTRGMI